MGLEPVGQAPSAEDRDRQAGSWKTQAEPPGWEAGRGSGSRASPERAEGAACPCLPSDLALQPGRESLPFAFTPSLWCIVPAALRASASTEREEGRGKGLELRPDGRVCVLTVPLSVAASPWLPGSQPARPQVRGGGEQRVLAWEPLCEVWSLELERVQREPGLSEGRHQHPWETRWLWGP